MVEVTSWRGTGSFHPVLTARVAAPREVVVAALAEGLRRRGMRSSYRGEDGFRATYRSLLEAAGRTASSPAGSRAPCASSSCRGTP